jgi:hypothetical protein
MHSISIGSQFRTRLFENCIVVCPTINSVRQDYPANSDKITKVSRELSI